VKQAHRFLVIECWPSHLTKLIGISHSVDPATRIGLSKSRREGRRERCGTCGYLFVCEIKLAL
jgi:hypothetical protein